MRKLNIFVFLSLTTLSLQAQFVNLGATVTIQPGATLRVETDFTNTSGTINNNGTIEVSGNLSNSGTLATTGNIKFITATGSPVNATVNTGGQPLKNVEMAKTSGHTVTLAAAATILGDLNFTGSGSKIVLGTYDLTLGDTSDVNTPGAAGYVVTDGAGKLVKPVGAGSVSKAMEIGDASYYSPITVNMTGNAAGNVSAQVIRPSVSLKYNDATDTINREWIVSTPTATSTSLTGTYDPSDVFGDQMKIKGSIYLGVNNWSFAGSSGSGNTVTASTTLNSNVRLSGQNFFGKATLKAFLAGALPSGTTMTNLLYPILPTNESPYAVSPYFAPTLSGKTISKPANATDWILIEVRNAGTPSSIISKTSGWILNDGSIVSYDSSPLRLKDAATTGHIALKHRNHLGVRTDIPINLDGTALIQNFTNPSASGGEVYNVYIDPTAVANNPNMKTVGSVRALWSGNANNDDRIKYSGSGTDITAISSAVLLNPLNLTFSSTFPLAAYHIADLNMNGEVKYSGSGTDITIISANVLSNPTNTSFSSTFPILKHLEN